MRELKHLALEPAFLTFPGLSLAVVLMAWGRE